MSNFPQNFDDDTTLPVVNDNLTEIGGDAINALRDAVFNIEVNIGLGAAGTTPSIAARLGLLINPDGTPNASAITSLGLVTLPINNSQIADHAGIPESKLHLDYRTQDLFNYIRDLSRDVNLALGWISITGVKLEPHLIGAIYRHDLAQIDVAESPTEYLNNVFRTQRDNTDSYTLISDINNELLVHQWADGSIFGTIRNIVTNDGSIYPSNYAHVASGIFVDTSRFQTIPQTDQDVQSVFEFIDQSSILLLGTRIQNLYANGVSVNSRSSTLTLDGYGQAVVPVTPAIAYLLNNGTSSAPVDSINNGDDIIQFQPSPANMASNLFDAQFASVRVGDIIRINYGSVEVAWVISEVKYNQMGPNKTYIVRIAGKNIIYSANAVARIDRPLFNDNKYGVLATALANSVANNSGVPASLIVASPRAAQVTGVGFNPDQFDSTHYLLYLALYPTGNPVDGYTILPAIDVTGNRGTTPGAYTLDSIVTATNAAFRQPGYNYRFIAFESGGEFGIMLADSYGNTSFSILNMIVSPSGFYDPTSTALNFPNNVIGDVTRSNLPDPLGFGILGANVASPPFSTSYGSAAASQFPTKLFVPLRRNNYYVNGAESERLNLQPAQVLDQYGDGYWVASIDGYTVIPGPSGHVITTYKIPQYLFNSDLKIGKTIVVQSLGAGSLVDFGRFVITDINFEDDSVPPNTEITVYDAVHANGSSPATTLATSGSDGYVAIYFNSDSVAFNQESATDFITPSGSIFKRYFEVYVDQNGNTYSHERGRLNTSGSTVTVNSVPLYGSSALSYVNLVKISPKLSGYNTGITKINLQVFGYDVSTGLFDGYLCKYDGVSATHFGPVTVGQKGQVSRFYDESNIDYIDIVFASTDPVPQITSPKNIDIQLFPTLSLDQEIMLISTCQFSDATYQVNYLNDARQFGNTSEQQFTTSAIDFINASDRELHENGIIRGFDVVGESPGTISFSGGVALVNGKIVQVDPQTVDLPIVIEALPIVPGGPPTTSSTVGVITWFICVNDKAEIELIASTDFDPFGPFVTQYRAAALTHLRLFYVINPNLVTPVPYQIRGTYFAGLVINQKDVTPIATIVSTINGTFPNKNVIGTSLNDARRFITNGYGGLAEPLTLGNFASFRNIDSLINWLYQFNNLFSASVGEANPISNKVIVKGHVNIISTKLLGYIFGEVHFEGDNGVFDVFVKTGFEIGGNVHFNNVIFNWLYDPVVYSDGAYVASDLINTGNGLIHMSVADVPLRNVSITNCHFVWVPLISGVGGMPPFIPVPPTTSTGINRYSWINIEFKDTVNPVPACLQSIDISNNTFIENTLIVPPLPATPYTFISNNQDTARAAIAFVYLSNTPSPAGLGAKLINATIRNNVCDKDQMIAIVPASTLATNTVSAAINTTGCIIEANTCGAISTFTQYNTPTDDLVGAIFTANFFNITLDKNNGLLIKDNTCKYITATDARGLDLVANVTNIVPDSGPITVSDNVCSWIQLPINVNPSFPVISNCVIKNNDLRAYDVNFRNKYLTGFPPLAINAAIRLSIIGASNQGNAIIDGNNIDFGGYATVSPPTVPPPPTVYNYFYGIFTDHQADITNNNIQNLATGANGIKVNVVSNCNIHHNKLTRGAVSWFTYIYVTGLNNIVTNNILDQTTPDGTNELLSIIDGTPGGRADIHDNVNQVISDSFSWVDNKYLHDFNGGSVIPPNGPAVNTGILSQQFYPAPNAATNIITVFGYSISSGSFIFAPTSTYLGIQDQGIATGGASSSVAALGQRNLSFTIPLTDHLPAGVKITSASIGVWAQLPLTVSLGYGFDTLSDNNNAFTLSLIASQNNLTSGFSSQPITDVKNNIVPSLPPVVGTDSTLSSSSAFTLLVRAASAAPTSTYHAVTQAMLVANTQFLTITTAPGTGFTTGNGYRINAQLDINYLTKNGTLLTDYIVLYFSPILVKYQW